MGAERQARVALVTGGGHRIGAAISRALHAAGCRVVVHYRRAAQAAATLADELNALRADSAVCLRADLCDVGTLGDFADAALAHWGRLDLLVNNASAFYATPVGSVTPQQWDELFGANLKGAFFLSQALAPALARTEGAIINIVDVYAELPLRQHAVYCMAKAGLAMMTKALALEMGPAVRVNGISPGAILWPSEKNEELSPAAAERLLALTALNRMGSPEDIAEAVRYLGLDARYVTGQVLPVDGGRTLF